MAGVRKFVGVLQTLLSETVIGQVLAKSALTDAQARAMLASASSLAIGLRAIGFQVAANGLPAPAFTDAPSISPTSGSAGATFTATDGTVNNGTVVSRRWLLGGVAIGTGVTVVPVVAGLLVLENTATGLGGTTVAISAVVAVSAVSAAARVLPFLGTNMQPATDGVQPPYLNRLKFARRWVSGYDRLPAVDANGYPLASTPGTCETYVVFDNPKTFSGVSQNYVFVSSKLGLNLTVSGATNVVRTTDTHGNDRVTFTLAQATFDDSNTVLGTSRSTTISGLPSASGDWSTFYLVRADLEPLLLSGRTFTDDALRTMATGGLKRLMDMCLVNAADNAEVDMTFWTPATAFTWAPLNPFHGSGSTLVADDGGSYRYSNRIPVEVACKLITETATAYPQANLALWFCIPFAFTDAAVRQLVQRIKANLPSRFHYLLEVANEIFNFANQPFYYAKSLNYPVVGSSSDTASYPNYGYRAAQMLAVARDQDGYSGQLITVLGAQNTYDAITTYELDGVRTWQQDVATSGSPVYNPSFAARYTGKPIGTVLNKLALATYLDGGYANISASGREADLATTRQQIANNDIAGIIQQHYDGSKLQHVADYTINNLADKFGPNIALARAEQMDVIAYEGQTCHELVPDDVQTFFLNVAYKDTRWQQLQADWLRAVLNAGFIAQAIYWDFGGIYANQDIVGDYTYPNYLATKQIADAPPVPQPLTISVTTSAALIVGNPILLVAKTSGGRGLRTVTWNGLAAGLVADDICSAYGTLSAAGTYSLTATVSDEYGTTPVSVTFEQDVTTVQTGYRYFEFTPGQTLGQQNPGDQYYSFRTSGITPRKNGAPISLDGWSVTADASLNSNSPASLLIDGDATTFFSTTFGSTGKLVLDAGHNNNLVPTDFLWGANTGGVNSSQTLGKINLVRGSADGVNWVTLATNIVLNYATDTAAIPMDYSPKVSLSGAQSQNEGNSGPTLFTYTITRSATAGAVSVPWTFAAGSTDASDYTGGTLPIGGSVAMTSGQATGTFTISVNGDATSEPDEQFTVSITAPSGYGVGSPSTASGTILNDDAPPGAWTPANLGSALVAWFDGQDASTVTISNSVVSAWSSKVGSFSATASGAAQPSYATAGINGSPALSFNGSNTLTFTAPGSFPGAGDFTIATMGQYTGTPGATYPILFSYGDGSSPGGVRYTGGENSNPNAVNSGTGGSGSNIDYQGETISTARPVIFQGVASTQVLGTTVDGSNLMTLANVPAFVAPSSVCTIGKWPAYGANWTGPIGEVLVIAGVLSISDRQKLERYLANRWGTQANLPAGHP